MIAIVDYRAGNLTSVLLACQALGAEALITQDPAAIRDAERIIFPGVGAAGAAMASLRTLGLEAPIRDSIRRGVPFLGICVGTQILLGRSEEDGGVDCLAIIPGEVKLFRPPSRADKVPQIGWNSVMQHRTHPLFDGIADASEFYFVHSYYPAPTDRTWVLGETDYAGVRFASVLGRDNVVATQFHTEKSGRLGLRLLQNFLSWKPSVHGGSPC
ncbi:MAG: imidazole glycerol phosphate synthase subunit HisH [Lentisphaerae bacterium]|nr:imidazole glycerol phosphate synthase subunit HisH [Lentisphaerota bacterium]